MAHARRCSYELKDALSDSEYKKKAKDLRFFELLDAMRAEEDPKSLSRMRVEFSRRLVFALASLCFVLVGIPLGIQSHRRQSSVGLGISLGVAGAFYFFCITAVSLSKKPELHAHWILVVPVVACLVLSVFLVSRND